MTPSSTALKVVFATVRDNGHCCLHVFSKVLFSSAFLRLTGSTTEGLFKISSDDGVISVAAPIDREITGDTVNLTVKVELLFKFV